MDSIDVFRPVFAYIAHLAARAAAPGADAPDAGAVKADLSLLMGDAMRRRVEPADPNFDQAWFALSVWLGGALERLPGCGEIAGELMPLGENRERDFYHRLELLLKPLGAPARYPHEIRDILRVYRTCLDWGGLAFGDSPEAAERITKYRERCRAVTAPRGRGVVRGDSQKSAGRSPRWSARGIAASAAVWIAAAAVPCALYGVYRFLLDNLYAAVAG